jgi:hypothetical protein
VKTYAGIGSRATPPDVCHAFVFAASNLAKQGWTLRTGGAEGADTAFLEGAWAAGSRPELYLPWTGFNGHEHGLYPPAEAFTEAAKYHPVWDDLSLPARRLHARNVCIVLGPDLSSPVSFVVCWTPGGRGGGGTGQALRVAKAHSIPVYDFGGAPTDEWPSALRIREVSER